MLLKEIVSIAIVVAVLALASAGLGLGWHVFAGQVQEAGAGKSDAEKLQGKWEVTTAQMFGKDVEGEEGDRLRMQKLVIEGDKMTMRHGGKFTLNPAKKPKELDFDLQEGPQQEQGVYRGIYELSGDDLTLAMAMPGAERPTEFKTQPGVPHMLLKLKRTK